MELKVLFTNKAERHLKHIPEPFRKRTYDFACSLADNPYPRGLEKLTDRDNTYRLRAGGYRVVWFIEEKRGLIHIVNIDKRPQAYQR